MKRIFLVAIMLAVAPLAFAQMKGMDMKDMDKKTAKGTVHQAKGVVKKVDAGRSKITIAHEPIQSIGWPSMTMAFTVKDKALLDKVSVDKKVEFEFVQQGSDYMVTSVK